jgi:hypothetical protein
MSAGGAAAGGAGASLADSAARAAPMGSPGRAAEGDTTAAPGWRASAIIEVK